MTRTRRLTAAAVIVAAGLLGTAGVAYAGDYPGNDSSHSSHHDRDHHSHHCGCGDDHDGDWCDRNDRDNRDNRDNRDGHDRDRDYRDRNCGDWHHRGLLEELMRAF
jgi:hypothetical protein